MAQTSAGVGGAGAHLLEARAQLRQQRPDVVAGEAEGCGRDRVDLQQLLAALPDVLLRQHHPALATLLQDRPRPLHKPCTAPRAPCARRDAVCCAAAVVLMCGGVQDAGSVQRRRREPNCWGGLDRACRSRLRACMKVVPHAT